MMWERSSVDGAPQRLHRTARWRLTSWSVAITSAAIATAIMRPSVAQTIALDTVLAQISERGRRLAAYEVAARGAAEALMASHPRLEGIRNTIARPMHDGWQVYFGSLDATTDTFWVAYQATAEDDGGGFRVTEDDPMLVGDEWLLRAARAVETSSRAFGQPDRLYNAYVLQGEERRFWVYFLPAQTVPGIWPHGGDIRYLVSSDGRGILETHRMHRDVIDFGPAPPGTVAASRTAVLDSLPEDSDVFLVLWWRPRRELFLVGENRRYRVDLSGKIHAMPRQ